MNIKQPRKPRQRHNKKVEVRNKPNKKLLLPFVSIIIIIGLLMGLSYYNAHKHYIKVGNEQITKSEYQYFYQYTLNKFQNDFSDYENYMNVDFSKDLSTQMMKDNLSWEEYFISQTDMLVYETLSTYNEAKKNNFKIDTSEVQNVLDLMELYAKNNGFTLDSYLKYLYGKNATEELIKHSIEINYISEKYVESLCLDSITDEEYEEYYNSHKDSLDEVEYYCINFSSKSAANAALNSIKTEEEFVEKSIEIQKSDGYNSITGLSNCNSLYSEWIFNAENGEMKVVEDTKNSVYYLLYKIDRHRDESLSRNIYTIDVSFPEDESNTPYFDKISEIEEEFDNTPKTKEDFIELAKKYNVDGSDGYMENVTESSIPATIRIWLFEEREIGDTTIIMSDLKYTLIYYDGEGIPQYKANSTSSIIAEKSKELMNTIKENYEFVKK